MSDLQVRLKYLKNDDDDWTKIEDKVLRKKIQNRLAKRKSRTSTGRRKIADKPGTRGDNPPAKVDEKRESTEPSNASSNTPNASINRYKWNLIKEAARSKTWLSTAALSEHKFLGLTQYSVLRAFLQNARLLALDFSQDFDDEALSPWTLANPYPTLTPHTLNPTPVQLCTPHHPYLDVVALPSFRDKILLASLDEEQTDQLCYDMHSGSFTIWGSQPWDCFAWEVSQSFVNRWAGFLDDEIIGHSNFWRAERGEPALTLPGIDFRTLEAVS